MDHTAAKLPEYPIVMAMKGVGPSLGPQLIAEIGDVSRFTHKGVRGKVILQPQGKEFFT